MALTLSKRTAWRGALALAAMAAVACGGNDNTGVTPPPPPPPPPPSPVIGLTPATITLSDTVGTASPAAMTVAVANVGSLTLDSLKVDSVTYSAGASGWVSTSLSGTSAPAVLTI